MYSLTFIFQNSEFDFMQKYKRKEYIVLKLQQNLDNIRLFGIITKITINIVIFIDTYRMCTHH